MVSNTRIKVVPILEELDEMIEEFIKLGFDENESRNRAVHIQREKYNKI